MITTPNANKIWQLYTGKITSITGKGKCYLGFSSTKPNNDGTNFTEPTSDDYKRIRLNILEGSKWTDVLGTINADGATSNEVTDGKVTNIEELCTAECVTEGGWPEFSHFGIFDCSEEGTPLAFDLLTDPDAEPDETTGKRPAKTLKVEYKHVAVFRKGTLTLSFI